MEIKSVMVLEISIDGDNHSFSIDKNDEIISMTVKGVTTERYLIKPENLKNYQEFVFDRLRDLRWAK